MRGLGTIWVVDRDQSVLNRLSRLLRLAGHTVVTFDSIRGFVRETQPRDHGCLVLDIEETDLRGVELQKHLTQAGITVPIIFMASQADVKTSVRAMKDGAVDFLTKPIQPVSLLAAVRQGLKKDKQARKDQAVRTEINDRIQKLTAREHEVLLLVTAGMLNKQIAARLGTSEKTIKVHRGRVMKKMSVQSVAELVRLTSGAEPSLATRPVPQSLVDLHRIGLAGR